jgi:3-dehydroquinate synthase class II
MDKHENLLDMTFVREPVVKSCEYLIEIKIQSLMLDADAKLMGKMGYGTETMRTPLNVEHKECIDVLIYVVTNTAFAKDLVYEKYMKYVNEINKTNREKGSYQRID